MIRKREGGAKAEQSSQDQVHCFVQIRLHQQRKSSSHDQTSSSHSNVHRLCLRLRLRRALIEIQRHSYPHRPNQHSTHAPHHIKVGGQLTSRKRRKRAQIRGHILLQPAWPRDQLQLPSVARGSAEVRQARDGAQHLKQTHKADFAPETLARRAAEGKVQLERAGEIDGGATAR